MCNYYIFRTIIALAIYIKKVYNSFSKKIFCNSLKATNDMSVFVIQLLFFKWEEYKFEEICVYLANICRNNKHKYDIILSIILTNGMNYKLFHGHCVCMKSLCI